MCVCESRHRMSTGNVLLRFARLFTIDVLPTVWDKPSSAAHDSINTKTKRNGHIDPGGGAAGAAGVCKNLAGR